MINQIYEKAELGAEICINILFLDDQPSELKSFESKIERMKDQGSIDFKYIIKTSQNTVDASSIIDSGEIDVLIADHNLHEGTNGLGFLEYIHGDRPEVIKVLFTGNISDQIRHHCIVNDFLFFSKNEDLHLLIQKIYLKYVDIKNIYRTKPSPLDPLYLKMSNYIIKDIEEARTIYKDLKLVIGNRQISPSELIMEIRKRSSFGNSYVENFSEGLNILKWGI